MELKFQKTQLNCLESVLYKGQSQEQTQEVRISDGMPDIGSILSTWGQVILRGKEWDHDTLTVSGGTMVWVQYLPEGGGAPQTVEGWLPFQIHWTISPGEHDGVMLAHCSLKSADCRSISARKLMLRTNVHVLLHAMQRQQLPIFQPGDVPEDVQLHTVTYPVMLPADAGEKAFDMEETLPLPAGNQGVTEILSAQLQPQVTESRIISDKVIFRGTAMLTVQTGSQEGIRTIGFDLPFSQYSELDQSYGEDGEAVLWPAVTALETELTDGGIRIKAGLVCQYEIRHRPTIQIVEDAYSPFRAVELQSQEVAIPGILESKNRTLHAVGSAEGMDALYAQILPQPIVMERQAGEIKADIPASFHVLCGDMEGSLRFRTEKWEESVMIPAGEDVRVEATLSPVGRVLTSSQGGNIRLQADLQLQTDIRMNTVVPIVTGLKLGQQTTPSPDRPSLILRRAGSASVWQIAKETGSTVEEIRRLNGISAEPDPSQMLLIPVK